MSKRRRVDDFGTEDLLFLEAMSRLGEVPIESEEQLFEEAMKTEAGGTQAPTPVGGSALEMDSAGLDDEDALFAESVGGLRPGSSPRRVEHVDAQPNRPGVAGTHKTLLRRIRQGVVVPERTIDLHGFARDAAKARLVALVRGARAEGLRLVLVITGRGNHSSGEAVLRQLVPQWLRVELGDLVQELIKPPASMGGEGAILVVLRPLKPDPA